MNPKELRDKTIEELKTLLETAKQDLIDNKKLLAANELANPRVITKTRKEVARLNTIISEKLVSEKNNDKEEA